ncbi:MAG: type VI secretion system tip protein TssI/VgrG [Planctomycetota bacterium]|nr:type VI secretion system tip protein TssI/VgrG [Planctomycetota bacterium]
MLDLREEQSVGGDFSMTFSCAATPSAFHVRSAHMEEELGRLFELSIDLESQDPNVPVHQLVGSPVELRLALGAPGRGGTVKLVNGFLSELTLQRADASGARYCARVVPFLWFLTKQTDSRIFQRKTISTIIGEVLKEGYDYGATDFNLKEHYEQHDYRVQYQESDFNFLSRLMEQEGVYFWVDSSSGHHVTRFADSPACHEREPGYAEIPYRPQGDSSANKWREKITELSLQARMVPARFVHTDYNFAKPLTPLLTKHREPPKHKGVELEVFEYPAEVMEVKESERLGRLRLEEVSAGHEVLEGATDALGLNLARIFRVTEHPSSVIGEQEWMVTRVAWQATQNARSSTRDAGSPAYSCRFSAIPASKAYRTPRVTPRPIIAGPQTAVVTGKEGEEIWTNHHGQVKVHFHWDRFGPRDQNSSCWIRVSQLWAGQGFGAVFTPRIGQEVIVEFLEGDPDRPIITGRVYNQRNMPPHDLPQAKETSTIMSRSTKEGGRDNFNEIRMVDTKGEELFYVQAEKDRTVLVKHDNTERVGNDEAISIGNDRAKQVGGDETVSVAKNRTEVVGINETVAVKANRTVTVDANETKAVKVNQTTSVGSTRQVQVGKIENKTVGLLRTQFTGLAETVSAGLVENINGGLATVISAGLMLELTASGNRISMGPWGIKITGSKIVIKGDQVIINP